MNKFAALLCALFSISAFCQEASQTNEVLSGKTIETDNTKHGKVTLTFAKGGQLYGTNNGSRDSGKWSVEGDKLCLRWYKWEYDGCGILKIEAENLTHYYPNSNDEVHFRAKVSK